ncbi:hypothetical protein M422DRAFT_238970 [Sphaerobolus stellatus SS14]|nr:hypothetical protein M422DRAFT_238970 [Sphaerobolus stellatus SS14]
MGWNIRTTQPPPPKLSKNIFSDESSTVGVPMLLGNYTFLPGCILPHILSMIPGLGLHGSIPSIVPIEVPERHFIWTKLTPHGCISHMARIPQFQDMYDTQATTRISPYANISLFSSEILL